jgi:hypothetical protein
MLARKQMPTITVILRRPRITRRLQLALSCAGLEDRPPKSAVADLGNQNLGNQNLGNQDLGNQDLGNQYADLG